MVEINLLPWRDYTRSYQKKIMKKILLVTLFISIILLVGLHQILSSRENALEVRINIVNQQLQQLQEEPSKQQQKVSPSLSKHHHDITTLFDELKKMNENDVCFTDIIRNSNTTNFIGKTRSAADLTDYLKNWSAAFLFSHIKINQLEQKSNSVFDFRFEAIGISA